MVSLLLGGLDEAQKFELGHSLDEASTGEQTEEQNLSIVDCNLAKSSLFLLAIYVKPASSHLICHETSLTSNSFNYLKCLFSSIKMVEEHDRKNMFVKVTEGYCLTSSTFPILSESGLLPSAAETTVA